MALSRSLPRPHRGSRFLLVALALLLAATPVLLAAPAHAEDTIGISARPAGENGQADGRTRFSYSVDPGQRVDDRFLVANTGSTAEEFTVFGTDAFNDPDGAFALLATAEQPTSIGAWVKFENDQNRISFTLQPGERRVLPFRLDLPAEATPGDHVGGLVASVLTDGTQVDVDRRVATRLYARVAGELQPRLAISGFDASFEGDWWNLANGRVIVRYTVDNPGNIALSGNISAGVNTWFGIPVADPPGGAIPDLLPGNSATYELTFDGVAQWGYLNPNVRLNPFVDDPNTDKALPVTAVSRDSVLIAVPWLVVIALLLAAVVAALIWWRRRREDQRAREWMEHTQAQARADAERELVGSGSGGEAPERG